MKFLDLNKIKISLLNLLIKKEKKKNKMYLN